MAKVKSFLEALLGNDERLVIKTFGIDGQLIPGAAPTVQKIFYEANKAELVAAAQAYQDKKKNK